MELAVGASESAMRSLLGKLGSLLAQEYTLISGVRSEIQYMNNELASMHAFLRKLGRATAAGVTHDEQTKDWIEQVRDVAYDIEDCVDDFAHRLSHQPRGEGLLVNLRRLWYTMATLWARRDIAAKIVELKNRAEEVGQRRMRYGVQDPKSESSVKTGRTTSPYATDHLQPLGPRIVGTTKPVGQEETIAKHGKWLTGNDEGPQKILAIVGFGGLGKTTMAQELLRRFREKFESRASVQASQKPNLLALLRDILKQVTPQKEPERKADGGDGVWDSHVNGPQGWNLQQLKDELKKQLQQKRYIILVDDVWSVSSWTEIWESLPQNENGSCIVVTTRFTSVANACCRQQGVIQMLNPLSHEESKELFFHVIHGNNPGEPRNAKESESQQEVPEDNNEHSKDNKEPKNSMETETKNKSEEVKNSHKETSKTKDSDEFTRTKEDVIKKCGGLPLAILTVAGLLSRRNLKDENHWKTVRESLNVELDNNPEGMTQILSLCYNDMPADQKNCLLYLSVFPKGCSIRRSRLMKRWIAEGFIVEKDGKTVEEVAEDTFNELISRNIVRPVEHSSKGKVKACQVHDMILEYIVSKSSEENFITVVGGHWSIPTPSNKVRRLSFHNSNSDDAKEKIENMNLSHIRSLTVFENLDLLPSSSLKSGILQVLDLEGCKNLHKSHQDKIWKMSHLKYLSLRKVYIKKISPKIEKLQYLETLDIRETHVTELPLSIGRLQKLVHLLAGNKSTRLALRFTEAITKMTALQTLIGIEICSISTPHLGIMQNLTKLKKLSIYSLRRNDTKDNKYDELLTTIEHLGAYSLKSLAIDYGFTGFLDSMGDLSTLPKYIISLDLSGRLLCVPKRLNELKTLENLTLSLTSLRTDSLEVLSQLPLLFSLTFSINVKGQDDSVVEVLQKNTMDSGGKIFVPPGSRPGGFESLKLFRVSAPMIPLMSFQDGAMPKVQRLELQFRLFEGAYGLENLESLQQVQLRVSQQASKATQQKVSDIRRLESKHTKKPTIVVDEYYE